MKCNAKLLAVLFAGFVLAAGGCTKKWVKHPDTAHYKKGDWDKKLFVRENVTVAEAKKIAQKHDEADFFFYVKGAALVLKPQGSWSQNTAVFFRGQPWIAPAKGLADLYMLE